MKLIIFFGILLQSGLIQASSHSLNHAISCAHSIFYGEVTSGTFTKPTSEVSDKEPIGDGVGTYKIKVIEHLAGKKLMNKVTISAKYASDFTGAPSKGYPALGQGYIFITTKDGRRIRFSPEHLSKITYIQNSTTRKKSADNFMKSVVFFYDKNDSDLKEAGISLESMGNIFIGYDYNHYKTYIAKEFGKCPTTE